MHMPEALDLLESLLPVARSAGDAIMQIYATPFAVRGKDDASPVTDADIAAERVILAALTRLSPGIPVVAEEQAAAGHIPQVKHEFWLIDPLDGTREFVQRNGEFTVNIALVRDARPVLGIVFAPALDRLFAGVALTEDASDRIAFEEHDGERRPISTRAAPATGLVVTCSRSHGREHDLDTFLARWSTAGRLRMGSSIKFGIIAAAQADIYPRLSPTMEWDIAAGDAVLRAAGGCITDLKGVPLRYGKPAFRNGNFVAWGRPSMVAGLST